MIKVNKIRYDDEFNCRGPVSPTSVVELANSIEAVGLLCPVIVAPEGDGYRLIAGHRRFIAVTEILGWDVIWAVVKTGLTESELRKINLLENLDRQNLLPSQELKAILQAYGECPNVKEVAKDLGRSDSWVRCRLGMRVLDPRIVKDVDSGLLKACDISVLLSVAADERWDLAKQLRAAHLDGIPTKVVKRRRKGVKSEQEIKEMMTKVLGRPRELEALSWVLGMVDDEEFRNTSG